MQEVYLALKSTLECLITLLKETNTYKLHLYRKIHIISNIQPCIDDTYS